MDLLQVARGDGAERVEAEDEMDGCTQLYL